MYDRAACVRRVWMPTIILLMAAALVGLWRWLNDEFRNDFRSMGSWLVVVFGVLALAFWLVILSGLPWTRRFLALFAVIVVVTGGCIAAVDSVEFQGNLVPVIHRRWERRDRGTHDTIAPAPIPAATEAEFPEYRNRDGGRLALVEATSEKHHELASIQALDGPKNWKYLTIARGRACVRNHEMMACYELPVETK
jgi:hypothetical protein